MPRFVEVAAPFCARLQAIAAFHREIAAIGARVVAARVPAIRQARVDEVLS